MTERLKTEYSPSPPRTLVRDNRSVPVYVYDKDTNVLISAALKRITGQIPDMQGLPEAMLYQPDEEKVVAHTIDMCLAVASHLNGSRDLKHNSQQSDAFINIATAIEAAYYKPAETPVVSSNETTTSLLFDNLLENMSSRTLSTGVELAEDTNTEAVELATQKVTETLEVINKPFLSVCEEIRASLTSNLEKKTDRLEKTDVIDTEEQSQLRADIIAINANLQYLDILQGENADWNTYENVCREVTEAIQDEISHQDINLAYSSRIVEPEARLQAINSLKNQFREWTRKKQNASQYIYGEPNKPGSGLIPEAVQIRRKKLSDTTNDQGIPILNVEASSRLSDWMEDEISKLGLPLHTAQDIADLYSRNTGDEHYIYELLTLLVNETGLDPNSSLKEFMTEIYVTSLEDSPLNRHKADFMRLVTGDLEAELHTDIRAKFDELNDEICNEVSTEDLIAAESARERQDITTQIYRDLEQVFTIYNVLPEDKQKFLEVHGNEIVSVLVASYELRKNANDKHLNPNAVLETLCRGAINGEPISLQIVRCLRWCYPNQEVEVAPIAGDWPTLSASGKDIVRREWVEREKLNIYDRNVVKPIKHQNIPIKEVVLLTTGDYDLTGPGYGFDEDHPQSINARNYVKDLRSRVESWQIFSDLPITVISFKEFIDTNTQPGEFDEIRSRIINSYRELFTNPKLNFVGFTDKSLERTIDIEHGHRTPFIKWWTRTKSREFTEHVTTFSLAMGVVVSEQQSRSPVLLTVSGNQYAGMNFSKGHLVNENTPPLGITLINSVNDGDQSEHFRKMTTVVE